MLKFKTILWNIFVVAPLILALLIDITIREWICPRTASCHWQVWFAWRPVFVKKRLRWLTRVKRRVAYDREIMGGRQWDYDDDKTDSAHHH
jgi:hypothetical protein